MSSLKHSRAPFRPRTIAAIVTIFMACIFGVARSATAQTPKRLKRADSFLGMHFDFHARSDCTEVGKNTSPEMIERVIDLVHPDYIQTDCKGHPGICSYPTKVGNPAPGFVGDPLRIWRRVTADRGVALYMHYSGIWDTEAIRKHPEWAAVTGSGKPSTDMTSPFGQYDDQLLIPQLRELAGEYGVDGVWVDGECWATCPDYGDAAVKAFREATGIQEPPRKDEDLHWFEFRQFHREAFRRHLRHYIAEVKKAYPDFPICSNWAFTDHMPEPVSAPVDFLSGDYAPDNSVNSARLSGRYLMRQGKPWDLMAWSFAHEKGKGPEDWIQKTAPQLMREAAVVVALGGGFQAYFQQKRDGSIHDEQMPVMAEVAKFCRARQSICHHAEAVPQVAVLLSTAAHYRQIGNLFSREDLDRVTGALQALLHTQWSVEILGEHHLIGRMAEYPLIVVPEAEYLEPTFKNELVAYVKAGGNLLLLGPKSAALFESELGATLKDSPKPRGPIHLAYDNAVAALQAESQAATLGAQVAPFGQLLASADPASASTPAASIAPLGKGKIAAVYFTLGRSYFANHDAVARKFLNDLARQLFPNPMVEVRGSSDVDVCLMRNHGNLLVNLVNAAGPHETEPVFDSIPPIGPLTITIRQPTKPGKITLEPSGQSLEFTYRDGKVELTVPRVDIHEIVVVDSPSPLPPK